MVFIWLILFIIVYCGALLDDGLEHVLHLLKYEGKRPSKDVHVLREHVGMMSVVKLFDVEVAILNLHDGRFIVIDIAVVRGREHCDHCREVCCPIPFVELVTCLLYFMCSDHAHQLVCLQECVDSLFAKQDRAPSALVLHKVYFFIVMSSII